MGYFDYTRRPADEVRVGCTAFGAGNPVRIQSMASIPTMLTDECVAQCRRMTEAGAELVRFTAQGVREAENLGEIRRRLREEGVTVPLVADIHFNPRAAFAAATQVEKVRINPGNFVDPGRTFRKISYTDDEYAAELQRIEEALVPFLKLCAEHGTAIRIGVNHGSLSDRIMSRYGDTPAGMTESAMEFLRVCRRHGFSQVVLSVKASNVVVMVETVRRLVAAMDAEDMHFPLHLGVTEAGDGDDGRVKSAVGIGALLAEGLGDTIRVSLAEDPERELPVARELVDYISSMADAPHIEGEPVDEAVRPEVSNFRRPSVAVGKVGGGNLPVVAAVGDDGFDTDNRPDIFVEGNDSIVERDAAEDVASWPEGKIILLRTAHANPAGRVLATLHEALRRGVNNPVIVALRYDGLTPGQVKVRAAADAGRIMLAGMADGLMIESDSMSPAGLASLSYGILQAARRRITRTEYIACPSCGRTMFDLQTTLARVKAATSSLRGLKIGVMGCVVNGPGEMADADYGYVGAGRGHVSLYRGKECVEKNVPEDEAVEHLVNLIKADGRWM